MYKLDLEKAEEPKFKLPTSIGSKKSEALSKKNHQTTVPVSWEICMQVQKQQLEPHMEQRTGSKSGEEYVKTIYYHPAYLTYIQY